MKGGRDMKKTFKLDVEIKEYIVLDEKGEKVFSIPKDTLCFNGEEFYKAFFEKNDSKININLEKAYSEELEKTDKIINNIYSYLTNILKDISKEINELDKKKFISEVE